MRKLSIQAFHQRVMNGLILLFFTIGLYLPIYGQNITKNSFFFNEFSASINKVQSIKGSDDGQQLGFGLGAYRSINNQRKVNFVFGLEYNLNKQFMNETYEGHFATAHNVQYIIHTCSVPFSLRYNIGNRVRFFAELGVFLDLIIHSTRKGTMHTYSPDQSNHLVDNEFKFKKNSEITSPGYGIGTGVGIKIPVKKRELIIKSDYKFGMRTLYSGVTPLDIRYFRMLIGIYI